MAQLATVSLGAPTRPVGGILASARSIDGPWQRGVTFTSTACVAPFGVPYCLPAESPTTKVPVRSDDSAEFSSFGVVAALECTTMGRQVVASQAADMLDVIREWVVGQELAHGLISGNPDLDDAVSVGASIDPAGALALIEDAIAADLYGRLGFIHVSPGTGTLLLSANAIWRDGSRWRTAAGNVVVISPGYDFDEIVATPEVYAMVGNRDVFDDVDRAVNTAHAFAEEIAIAVFDPCFVVEATIGT